MTVAALPHSGTHGSPRARRSPWHFAVRRALHRLLAPRHPPAALGSLIIQYVASSGATRTGGPRKTRSWMEYPLAGRARGGRHTFGDCCSRAVLPLPSGATAQRRCLPTVTLQPCRLYGPPKGAPLPPARVASASGVLSTSSTLQFSKYPSRWRVSDCGLRIKKSTPPSECVSEPR